MSTIVDTIQAIVRQELRRMHTTELGVVVDVYPHSANDDNDNYGCDVRLKNSGLLLKRVPIATNHIGSAAIPYKDDLVLLNFVQADANQGIVVGRLYNDSDRPPLNNPNEMISRIPLAAADEKTIKSAIRNIQSNSPSREILVEMPPKITVSITDGTVRATAGKTEMKLDQSNGSGGTVTVVAGRTKITLNQDGDVTIEAAGSMKLKANGDFSIEGQSVNITSKVGDIDIEAKMQAKLKGTIGATVDGGVSTTVQGATNTIKGITSFSM